MGTVLFFKIESLGPLDIGKNKKIEPPLSEGSKTILKTIPEVV
jgi:hypothetical protein